MQTSSDRRLHMPSMLRRHTRPAVLLHILLIATIVFGFGAMLMVHTTQDVAANTGAGDAPHALYLPNIGGPAINTCDRDPTPNAFGVQMYGNTGKTSEYYNALKDSGAQWVRVPIEWDQVEPDNRLPGDYDWSSADLAVSGAADGCFHLIVTHRRNPAWAATNPNSVIDKASLDELVEYMRALVERYDGDGFQDAPGSPVVDMWELYNEPDAGTAPFFVGWGDYPEEYAEMLKAVYPVIKAANPNAQVAMGGIAHDWFEETGGPFVKTFMEDVLKAGGGDYFDVMNFHSYPAFYTNWAELIPGLYEKAIHLLDLLEEYGYSKPIIVTESGWHSDDSEAAPSTHDEQSQYIVELFTQSLAVGADFMIYWMLHDPGPVHPHESGLVTRDNPPVKKPAFDAFRVLVQKLDATTFLNRLSENETRAQEMQAYRFDAPARNQTVYVAWLSPIETTQIETLRIPGIQATVTTMYGVTTTVVDADDGDDDGHIKVNISNKPVYIEVAK